MDAVWRGEVEDGTGWVVVQLCVTIVAIQCCISYFKLSVP